MPQLPYKTPNPLGWLITSVAQLPSPRPSGSIPNTTKANKSLKYHCQQNKDYSQTTFLVLLVITNLTEFAIPPLNMADLIYFQNLLELCVHFV